MIRQESLTLFLLQGQQKHISLRPSFPCICCLPLLFEYLHTSSVGQGVDHGNMKDRLHIKNSLLAMIATQKIDTSKNL